MTCTLFAHYLHINCTGITSNYTTIAYYSYMTCTWTVYDLHIHMTCKMTCANLSYNLCITSTWLEQDFNMTGARLQHDLHVTEYDLQMTWKLQF